MSDSRWPTPYKQLRRLPRGWDLLVGVDTGTYMSATFVIVPPGDEQQLITIAEFPNYRYVAHEIELLGMSIPEWAKWVMDGFRYFCPDKTRCSAWADQNTQFRTELAHYGIDLRGNTRRLELRTEIGREYMQSTTPAGVSRSLFASWLEVLPYEMEHAKWPDGTTGAGKFERLKEHDHTLDCYEHCASRRPRTKPTTTRRKKSFLQAHLDAHGMRKTPAADPHLGAL